MQCQICKQKTATIHLTEIVNGERSERHLCQSCAKDEGLSLKNQVSLNELLSTLLTSQQQQEALEDEQLSCPACGITLAEFKNKGLLGCPNDYEVFKDILEPLMARAHNGNITHQGKVPKDVSGVLQNQSKIRKLQRQLDTAVSHENYEKAAQIRDQIKKLL